MSTQVNENAEAPAENTEANTENGEATEETLKPIEEAYSSAAKDLIAQLNELIATQNKYGKWLKDNSRDPQELVDAFKSGEIEDEEIQPLLEKLEKAKLVVVKQEASIFQLAEKKAKAKLDKETDTEAVEKNEKAFGEAAKNVRETEKALTTIFDENVLKYADEKITRQRKSTKGTGAGTPKLRGMQVKVNGELALKKMGKSGERKSSFGAAQDRIGNVTLETLIDGYRKHPDVNTEDSKKFPVGKAITYTVKDTDGKDWELEVTKTE